MFGSADPVRRLPRRAALAVVMALGVGLGSFLAAVPAWAAPYTLTGPAQVRVGGPAVTYSVAVAASATPAGDAYCVAVEPLAGSALTTAATSQLVGSASYSFSVTFGPAGAAGRSATMALFAVAGPPGACPTTVPSGATVLDTVAVNVGGSVANVVLTPATATVPAGVAATFGWSVTDSAGRATFLSPDEALVASGTSNPANGSVTFNGASATSLRLLSSSLSTFSAQNTIAGTATITLRLDLPGGPLDTASLVTTPSGSVTVSPASTTVPVGGTSTFTVTVRDAANAPLRGVPVLRSVAGRNPRATATIGSTNAAGEVTSTLTDTAAASSTALTDTLTFTANGFTRTATVTYTPNVPAGLTVQTSSNPTTPITGTFVNLPASGPLYDSGTTPFRVDTTLNLGSVAPTASSRYAFSVRIRVAPGGVPAANTEVRLSGNVAGANGTWILNGATPVSSATATTNSLGQVRFVVLSTATGTVSWSAAAAGLTQGFSASYVNQATDARTVSITPAAVTMAPSTPTTVTGTVADRYGNPVSGIPLTFTTPTGGPVTLDGGVTSVGGTSNAAGQASARVVATQPGATGTVTVTGTRSGSQLNDPVNRVGGTTVPGVPAGVPSSAAPVTVSGQPASVVVTSPSPGSRISSGGYFNVYFATANVPAGTTAFLVLDGRAKARTVAGATGGSFARIPAEPGSYDVRVGGGGAGPILGRSARFSLTIVPFQLDGYTLRDGDAVFRAATGNFSPGTVVSLTRNGVAVATARITTQGAALTIAIRATAGTYQVRVNSNQGYVYGARKGVITLN